MNNARLTDKELAALCLNEAANLLDDKDILTEGIGKTIFWILLGPYIVIGSAALLGNIISKAVKGASNRKNNKLIKNNKFVSAKWCMTKFKDIDSILDKISEIKYDKNIFNYLYSCINSDEKIINLYKKELRMFLSDLKRICLTDDDDKNYAMINLVFNKYKSSFTVPKSLYPKEYNLDKDKNNWIIDNSDNTKQQLKQFFKSCDKLEESKSELMEILYQAEEIYHNLYSGAEYGDFTEFIIDDNFSHILDDSGYFIENYIKYLNYIELKFSK